MMTSMSGSRKAPPATRPLWLVVAGVTSGSTLVAAIIALGTHFGAYMIGLYSFLIGMAGGLFGALLTDRLKTASGWRVMLTGVVLGLSMYGLYWYFFYLFAQPGPATTFTDHLRHVANDSFLGRLGWTWFRTGPVLFTIICVLEIALVAGVSARTARISHDVFGKT